MRAVTIFVIIVIVFAILNGLSAAFIPPADLIRYVGIRDFFDAILPVLAAGALIKYLVS